MGKGLNPADAFRKEQRQRELKKAKEKKKVQQEVSALLSDPNKIDEEIVKVQKQSDENRMDNGLKIRLKELYQMKSIALKKQQQAKLLTSNSTTSIQFHGSGSQQSARNLPIMQLNHNKEILVGGTNGIPLPPPRPIMGGTNGVPLPPPRPIMGGSNGIPLPPSRPISNQIQYNGLYLQQQVQNRRNNIDRSISDPLDPSNKYFTEQPIQPNLSNYQDSVEYSNWDKWDTGGYEEDHLNETINYAANKEEEEDYGDDREESFFEKVDDLEGSEEDVKAKGEGAASNNHNAEVVTHAQPFFGALNMPKPLSAEELLNRRHATVSHSSHIGPSMDSNSNITTNSSTKCVEVDNSNVINSLLGSYGDEDDESNDLIIPQNNTDAFLQQHNEDSHQVSNTSNKLKVIKAEPGIKALVPNILRFKRVVSNNLPVSKKSKSTDDRSLTVAKTNSVDDAYLSFMNEIKDVI